MGIQTYGILYPPFDAVRKTNAPENFTFASEGYSWGVIDAVNYHNVKTTIGNQVLFKLTDAILVTAGGTDYYIIDEENLIFKANPIL